MDTIYALSTAPGRAGIAVIRISGPATSDAVEALAGSLPPPRYASLCKLKNSDGEFLDQALVIRFVSGQSFTGEDVAELHCHGSPAVVQAILEALSKYDRLRPAEAGEFTRRALENGRLDLSQVEGLADLLEAETETQRKQALRVFSGDLAGRINAWRKKLIRAIALVEATIDFADEEVPQDMGPEVGDIISSVLLELENEIARYAVSERIRSGFEVAIVGPPNAGKSTLLNALAGREAAITSSIAGTTRDVIEVRMDLRGIPVTILDTAGIREPQDEVERLGIERAKDRASKADLRVYLYAEDDEVPVKLDDQDIVLIGKSDIYHTDEPSVSGLTGDGIPALLDYLANYFESHTAEPGLAIRDRHRVAMDNARALLSKIILSLHESKSEAEVVAELLRRTAISLDSIVGRFDIESVLDEIFSSFCLGK